MNIWQRVVQVTTGRLDKKSQRVMNWQNSALNYTSDFVTSIHNKIASEIAKVNFNHVRYQYNPDGIDTLSQVVGSDIEETLNWKPKGYNNSTEFWQEVVKQMLLNREVHLKPTFKLSNGVYVLDNLELVGETDSAYNVAETVNLVSPFFTSQDVSLLDNALSGIATKLDQNKLRAVMRINAVVGSKNSNFASTAHETIKLMQEGANYNGIGFMDSKSEIVEFKKDYSVLNQDEIQLIKNELLSAYFMTENILLGKASQDEQMLFYNGTIIPILQQLEKELTYKLLSTSKRIMRPDKKYYERILIDNQIMKFASIKELISFYHENTQAPTVTVNELRLLMGMLPIEGGDVYLSNANTRVIADFNSLETNITKGDQTEDETV